MGFKSETSILATELGGQSRYQINPLYLNRSKRYWLKKKKAWSPSSISQREVVGCYSDWTEEPSLQGLTMGCVVQTN